MYMQTHAYPKRGRGGGHCGKGITKSSIISLSKQEELSMVVYFNVKTRGSDQSFLFSNSQEIKKVWFIQDCHVFYRVVLRELGYKKMSLTL